MQDTVQPSSWVVAGPVGQYFPRADGVELFHAVEQQDGDVAWGGAGLVGHVLSVLGKRAVRGLPLWRTLAH
jgi:hypothetical protein